MTKNEAIKVLKMVEAHGLANTAKEMAIEALEETNGGRNVCFHCGARAVIWQCDYDFEDMGYEGEGVVNCLRCSNCGADIEYRVRCDNEEDGDENS